MNWYGAIPQTNSITAPAIIATSALRLTGRTQSCTVECGRQRHRQKLTDCRWNIRGQSSLGIPGYALLLVARSKPDAVVVGAGPVALFRVFELGLLKKIQGP